MLKILYIHPDCKADLTRAGLLTDAAVLGWDRGERIVYKNWADMFRWSLEGLGTVYVKRYFPQRNRLFGVFRKNLAVREFRSSQALLQLGIPQAEPVFCGVVRGRSGLVRCGIYIMRQVEGAESLDVILDRMRQSPDEKRLARIAEEVSRLLTIMHRGNFCHWDLKPRNLLVSERGDSILITPIDARSGRRMTVFRRRTCIERDRRFLLREPLLAPYLGQLH